MGHTLDGKGGRMKTEMNKREAKAWLRHFVSSNPEGKFSSRLSKNGRGDYGYDETFINAEGAPVLCISMDGARSSVKFYRYQ